MSIANPPDTTRAVAASLAAVSAATDPSAPRPAGANPAARVAAPVPAPSPTVAMPNGLNPKLTNPAIKLNVDFPIALIVLSPASGDIICVSSNGVIMPVLSSRLPSGLYSYFTLPSGLVPQGTDSLRICSSVGGRMPVNDSRAAL